MKTANTELAIKEAREVLTEAVVWWTPGTPEYSKARDKAYTLIRTALSADRK